MESLMMNYCEDEVDLFPATQISNGLNNNYMDLIHESNEDMTPMPDTTENILGEFGVLPPPARILSAADSTNESLKNNPNDSNNDHDDDDDDDDVVVVSDDDDDSTTDVISAIVISRVETVVEESTENICSSSDLATTKALSKKSAQSQNVSVSSTSNKDNYSNVKIEQEVSSQTRTAAKENLQSNNVKQVPKLRIFKCNLCPYSSMIRFGLKRHLLTHSDSKNSAKLKCISCSYETETKKALLFHCLHRHKTTNLKCVVCHKLVPLQLQNDHSLRCKKKDQTFRCNGCDYKTVRRKSLVCHRKKCTNKLNVQSKRNSNPIRLKCKSSSEKLNSSCKYCSYSTKSKANMKKHYIYHTKYNRPIFRCSSCDYKSFKITVRKHFNATHKALLGSDYKFIEVSPSLTEKIKSRNENKPTNFSCNFCSYVAANKQCLVRHIQSHRIGKQPIYSCGNCDYKSFKHNLCHHSLVVHGVKQTFKNKVPKYEDTNHFSYRCTLCSYSTGHHSNLKYHQRAHAASVQRLVSCSFCDYTGFMKSVGRHLKLFHSEEVNNHKKKLAKKSPVKNKSIPNRTSTIIHVLYVCEICDYSTEDKDILIKHKLKHSNLKKRKTNC